MRLRILLLSLLLLSWPPASAGPGDVRIAEIVADPADGEREFVELWNAGAVAVNITGWTLSDTAGNTYTFDNATLPAGGRLVVWGGGVGDARGPAWSKATVWNNAGDQVMLRDPLGADIDALAYGSATWPDDRNDTVPSAPVKGRSLTLHDGTWIDADPTPGTVSRTSGASFQASVENVAPTVTMLAPDDAQPGSVIDITIEAHDGNGDDDIATWGLTADGVPLANGTAGGMHAVRVGAPTDRDTWTFTLTARDAGGLATTATHAMQIAVGGIAIVLPAGGIRFPAFPPGAAEVVTNTTFTLRNTASHDLAPRIDVSDLRGAGTIPVAGRLDIGWAGAWATYDGPLTRLPVIPAGASVEVTLRLRDLPDPLPAGDYGTSFTVIA